MLGVLLSGALACLLATTALEKLVDLAQWRRSLARYPLGVASTPGLALAVPVVEVVVGALLVAYVQPLAAISAAALFSGFALVLAMAVRRGARGDCGCFGGSLRTRVGPRAVRRALTLSGVSLLTALTPADVVPWYVLTSLVVAVSFGLLLGRAFLDLRRIAFARP